jgi:mRNA-degrading endonuclease toxin of MazEF toxin-antitoxin module
LSLFILGILIIAFLFFSMKSYENDYDVVVAFVSSKIPAAMTPADIPVTRSQPGFRQQAKKTDSVIRLDKIATIIRTSIVDRIGELPPELRSRVNEIRRAMEHLKNRGVVVYLKISFEEMEKRLRNITTRGIVLVAGQGLRGMYDQRAPLYGKYADRTIDCSDKDFETVARKVIDEQYQKC